MILRAPLLIERGAFFDFKKNIMRVIDHNSLARTLDKINTSFFFGESLTKSKNAEAAKWIAARRGLENSYANMFAPTAKK